MKFKKASLSDTDLPNIKRRFKMKKDRWVKNILENLVMIIQGLEEREVIRLSSVSKKRKSYDFKSEKQKCFIDAYLTRKITWSQMWFCTDPCNFLKCKELNCIICGGSKLYSLRKNKKCIVEMATHSTCPPQCVCRHAFHGQLAGQL